MVVLVRGPSAGRGSADAPREVFWVRRARTPAFAGYHAFPGGSVDGQDASLPVAGLPADEARLFVAAVRELFEETGVLLARLPAGAPPDLTRLRERMLGEKLSFDRVLAEVGAALDPALLRPAGRWLTPPFAPVRFDARFYLAELPEGQDARVWSGELERGEWIDPREALRRWESGEALLHPPARHVLESLTGSAGEELLRRLNDPPHLVDYVAQRVDLQRGIQLVPLLAPTLPPAHHTTCYLLGDRELLVVDPASPWPDEQRRLHELVGELVAEGRRVAAIVLTHTHPDHVGGALAAQEALGAPIWAHTRAAAHWSRVDRALHDGEVLRLDGEFPMAFKVFHTPGHASDHLCLFEPRSRAMICGDMLSGASTIVIDPPDGDMEAYLGSLQRLSDLQVRSLYPSHGDPMPDGPARITEAIAHRRWREEKLLGVLAAGPVSLDEVTERLYDDAPRLVMPLAKRSALASLDWLERRGRVVREGEKYKLAPD